MKWNIQPYMERSWAGDIPRTHEEAREVWQQSQLSNPWGKLVTLTSLEVVNFGFSENLAQ